jgi:hypothetical protein
VKKIQSDRFSPARAFFPESVALSGCCHSIRKKPENNRCRNFFPDIDGYSCQSCDEPYPGVFPGEISFVSALYFPDSHPGAVTTVDYIGARVISYGNEHVARDRFPEISAGFPLAGNLQEGTCYTDAYSSESWLWVPDGAKIIVCQAAHSAPRFAPGTDCGAGKVRKILLDVARAIADYR